MISFAEFGALAFRLCALLSIPLAVAGPAFWILPKRFIRAYFAILVGDRLLWYAVYLRLAAGLPLPLMEGVWAQFVISNAVFFGPVLLIDLLFIALKADGSPAHRPWFRQFTFLVFLACAPALVSYALTPYWIQAVEGSFIDSARGEAHGDPYCVAYLPDTYAQFSIRPLMVSSQIMHIYPDRWFHAVLVIERQTKREVRHWSFAAMKFVPTPPVFQLDSLAAVCGPIPDPFALTGRDK